MSLTIEIIPVLSDNYAYILRAQNGKMVVVDPGEAQPVLDHLKNETKQIEYVLNTHKHWDHTDGNARIIKESGARLVAPAEVAGADSLLSEQNDFVWQGHVFQVLETPCHTAGHICLYCEEAGVVFTGDTLFSLGCGRFFEGDAQDMFAAFEKLRALPDETLIYCGHEYTASNGAFALHVDPDNQALQARMAEVQTLRAQNQPTLPVSLKMEKATNPFLRAKSPSELATVRARKDVF